LSFLCDYVDPKVTETSLSRDTLRDCIMRLFRRSDFPEQIFVALDDSAVVSKGDIVWMNIDCEHPYDWVPLPRIDELVLNLPTKEAFLSELGVERLEDVSSEAETLFWKGFPFQFAKRAAGVRVHWK
jgi:hypothetical protein